MTLGTEVDFPKDDIIIRPGDEFTHLFLLIRGRVALYRTNERGEKHMVYVMNGACPCAMSMVSSIFGKKSTVEAVVESDAHALVISRDVGRELMASNKEWQELVLNSVLDAWQDSLDMLDSLAFDSLETRLLVYLKEARKRWPNAVLRKSHAEVASDLNVSRESVSRVLKKLENADKIHLGHGSIKILDLDN